MISEAEALILWAAVGCQITNKKSQAVSLDN